MDEDERTLPDTPDPEPSAADDAISETIDDERADVEESVRDEGRDDAAVIIDTLTGRIDTLAASIDERLSAIERAQRDTFASIVVNGGIVSERGATEVDRRDPVADYDLTI